MKNAQLFILLACFALSSASFGALNAYLTISDASGVPIDGGATDPNGNDGKVLVIGFSHEVFAPRDASTGKPAGARQHEPIRITKFIDQSTPLLLKALCEDKPLSTFELRFYKDYGTGQPVKYYTIHLINASIAGIRQEMLNNEYPENVQHKEREHIILCYDSIEWVHTPSAIEFDDPWDYQGADIPISDLSGDGQVNLIDFAIMADEWLRFMN